ncbi:hypothetical protein CAOG_008176 [Capsaspora owczarzaki ATCC 30864]|uniref:Uncharacterized protein n=1 Tax=Capsaspora owczarzaki (strain ATCC 30864) TaxID=595528 RepID=A0A0D2WYR3_CAPO3|nr:hypothetical protein CAOG_008176 [Capsaspora owczarzaki ATCC 30864]
MNLQCCAGAQSVHRQAYGFPRLYRRALELNRTVVRPSSPQRAEKYHAWIRSGFTWPNTLMKRLREFAGMPASPSAGAREGAGAGAGAGAGSLPPNQRTAPVSGATPAALRPAGQTNATPPTAPPAGQARTSGNAPVADCAAATARIQSENRSSQIAKTQPPPRDHPASQSSARSLSKQDQESSA